MVALSDLVRLTKAQQKLVAAVSATRQVVTYDQLAVIMGYNGECPSKMVHVQICKARKAIPELPVQIVRTKGVRWNG